MELLDKDALEERRLASDLKVCMASLDVLDGERARGKMPSVHIIFRLLLASLLTLTARLGGKQKMRLAMRFGA